MKSTLDFENGEVLLLNKPLGWTSFDLVRKVRYLVRVKKVGHAGTLDPLATGLVIICTGKMTKQIDSYQAQEKEYTGIIRLGMTTPCYDLEQEPDHFFQTSHITEEQVRRTVKKFTGIIQQFPPPHSAVKIDGKRAYELARKGKEVEMKPREVTISEFEITKISFPDIAFRVVCTKGTYIRSLAHDFGKALESGACLAALCRTRIGSYLLSDALTPEEFAVSLQPADNQ